MSLLWSESETPRHLEGSSLECLLHSWWLRSEGVGPSWWEQATRGGPWRVTRPWFHWPAVPGLWCCQEPRPHCPSFSARLKSLSPESGEVAQSAKSFPCKCKDTISIPRLCENSRHSGTRLKCERWRGRGHRRRQRSEPPEPRPPPWRPFSRQSTSGPQQPPPRGRRLSSQGLEGR